LGICRTLTCAHFVRLYLVEPIDMDKSFNPSPQLKSYMERAMQKEKEILEKCRIASQIIW